MSQTDSWRGVKAEEREEEVPGGVVSMLRRRSLRLLGSLLKPHKKRIFIASIFMVADLVGWLTTPYLIGLMIDKGIEAESARTLVVLVVVLVGLQLVEILAFAQFLRMSGKIGQDVLIDLRTRVFQRFQRLSLAFHEKYTSGRVVARLTSDIDAISELLATGLHEMIVSVLAIAAITGIMIALDWQLAASTVLVFPVIVALTLWFRKHSERAYRAVRDAVALVIVFFNESLGGIRAVQAFRREPRNQEIFDELDARYRDANLRSSQVAATYGPGIRFLGQLAIGIALLYGGYRVMKGAMSIGILISFTIYLRRWIGPLQDLSQFYNVFQAAAAALEKLAGVMEEPNSVPEPEEPPPAPESLAGEVAFEHVTFAYRETPVLHNVTFVVPAAQTVALVGETGAGKTTIARLTARLYDPTEGRVALDGIDLREFTDERLRRAVVVVTQESFLFGGTVADNIGFGRPGASIEEIEQAANAIGAHEFISGLPDGYHTDVKKRGGRLSAGQKQLVSFARAFLADPSVLILDEATSSLDIPTERLVQHALRTLLADRTAFIIAHRLTTVEIADRVLVVHDGRIVEDGSPRDLLEGGGRYQELHRAWLESLV